MKVDLSSQDIEMIAEALVAKAIVENRSVLVRGSVRKRSASYIIYLNALVEFFRELKENQNESDA